MSSDQGALVAAKISNPSLLAFTPSSSAKNWLMTCRPALPRMSLRLAPSASTSSKNSTQGVLLRAYSNSACSLLSLLPKYISSTSWMPTLIKALSICPAVARARCVLPQPGGPYIKMPPPMALP